MSGKWISIARPPCGPAFAVSVASWAMAGTMDSPRPWWSSTRAVKSLQGLEDAVDLLRRDRRPVFVMETMAGATGSIALGGGDDGESTLDDVEDSESGAR